MNRREFFKAASVAPVAVPMAAAAAAKDPFIIGMTIEHADLGNGAFVLGDPHWVRRQQLLSARRFRPVAFDIHWDDPRASVEAQMREHDLFDFG